MRDNTVSYVPITRIIRDKGCLRPTSLKYQCGPVPAPRVGPIITDKTERKEERREWADRGHHSNGNR